MILDAKFENKNGLDSSMNYLDDCTPEALGVIMVDALQHFAKVVRLGDGVGAGVNLTYYKEEYINVTMSRSDWPKAAEIIKAKIADVWSGKHLRKGCRVTYRDPMLMDIDADTILCSMLVGFHK